LAVKRRIKEVILNPNNFKEYLSLPELPLRPPPNPPWLNVCVDAAALAALPDAPNPPRPP
jgi:hypothetical protein